MQIFIKTLKGTNFEIQVKPEDTVADVKNSIEISQGKTVYPADQQMLIHQGKVLKDETTLAENNVAEKSFIVIMLRKAKGSPSGASTTTFVPAGQPPTATSAPANPSIPAPATTTAPTLAPLDTAPTSTDPPASVVVASNVVDAYGQAASNLVAGNSLEQTIEHILDIGGGTWDRGTVVRALRAAFNNPERAVEYLYSGIPEQAAVPPDVQSPTGEQEVNPSVQAPQPPVQPSVPSAGPNANPLNLFPQGLPSVGSNAGAGSLDFLRNSPQFRALQAMVQANPQILQPMLQELGRQNPHIMRLIQGHQAEFFNLISEPSEGGDNNLLGQLAEAVPQSITVTPEEGEAIERCHSVITPYATHALCQDVALPLREHSKQLPTATLSRLILTTQSDLLLVADLSHYANTASNSPLRFSLGSYRRKTSS